MKRIDKTGRLTLLCMAAVALVVMFLTWIDILPPCRPGDAGINIVHMLTKGCR